MMKLNKLIIAGITLAPQWASAATWTELVNEGGSLSLNGRPRSAIIRFGAVDRWYFRTVGSIPGSHTLLTCNAEHFSNGTDPYPNAVKVCEISTDKNPLKTTDKDWSNIEVDSDGNFKLRKYPKNAIVRYEGEGGVVYRSIATFGEGSYKCNDDAFGSPGISGGACAVYTSYPWSTIADEGETVNVDGSFSEWSVLRYGHESKWNMQSLRVPTYQFTCANSVFGDPATGKQKKCQINEFSNLRMDTEYLKDLANEGGTFSTSRLDDSFVILYGADSAWAYYPVSELPDSDNVLCSNDLFNGDPAPGKEKSCKLYRTDENRADSASFSKLRRLTLTKGRDAKTVRACIDYTGDIPSLIIDLKENASEDVIHSWRRVNGDDPTDWNVSTKYSKKLWYYRVDGIWTTKLRYDSPVGSGWVTWGHKAKNKPEKSARHDRLKKILEILRGAAENSKNHNWKKYDSDETCID